MNDSTPKLQLDGITKTFFPYSTNERVALDNLSLSLDDGDFVTVVGSNGAGKSTLLSVVAGVYRPDRGTLYLDGRDITKLGEAATARLVGRVFQDPMAGTAPELTIEENLAIALHRGSRRGLGRGVTNAKRRHYRDVLAVIGLGLEDRLSTKVAFLSGGQRQALCLVMAVASRPAILLLDEHTAALDPARAELITQITASEVASHQLTTLMVTHNLEQALRLGNRLVLMHEGKIELELSGETKRQAGVDDLLTQFTLTTGGAAPDRTLLRKTEPSAKPANG
ncbi:MAG: ATP-binding cassette domain-containing protein [Propionibacteriaceae bacterium]|jgi:putative ABC transport system ATP-binding protein|nr:ATP-binding cassette domain-containing protein [Propionibacteriaceae bacterium]